MAKARMLHNEISKSLKVDRLPLPARLLFTWMIAWADDHGRMKGELKYVKGTVVPLTNWSVKHIEEYLLLMKDVGLIYYWQKNNEWFIQFVNWKEHQRIRKDRRTQSKLPSFLGKNDNHATTKSQPDDYQKSTQSNERESNPSEVKVLKKIERNSSSVDDISSEDIKEISDQYKVPEGFVQLQLETLKNYCSSKGKVYKDYKAALKNFVVRQIGQMAERRMGDPTKRGIDATDL